MKIQIQTPPQGRPLIARKRGGRCNPLTLIMTVLLSLASLQAQAQVSSWTGTGGDDLWSNPNNWSPIGVPAPGQAITIIAAGTYTVLLDMDVNINTLTLGNGAGSQTLTIDGTTLEALGDVTIINSGQLEVINTGEIAVPPIPRNLLPGTLTNWGSLILENGNLNKLTVNAATMTVRGNCQITEGFTNDASGTLEVLGSAAGEGSFTVNNGTGMTNNGIVKLDTETAGVDARLVVMGDLNNLAPGILRAWDPGFFGGDRIIDGNLVNNGTVEVLVPLTLTGASHNNNPGANIQISGGSSLQVMGGDFNNSGSTTSKTGGVGGDLILDGVNLSGTLTATSINLALRGTTLMPGSNVTNNTLLIVEGSCQVDASATITNNGAIDIVGTAIELGELVFNSDWTNNGTLNLTASGLDESKLEVIGGTYTNLGTTTTQFGAGGPRTILAELDNQSILTLNHDLYLSSANANHQNGSSGTITLNSGTFVVDQTVGVGSFVNDGTLTVNAANTFYLQGGTFQQSGTLTKAKQTGTSGTVFLEDTVLMNSTYINTLSTALINSDVDMSSTINNQGTLYVKGVVNMNGTLTNTSPAGYLLVEGTSDYGLAHIIFPAAWTNQSTIEFNSNADADSILEIIGGGVFTNSTTGIVSLQIASGGDRIINAALNNEGMLSSEAPARIDPPIDVVHSNGGTINITDGTFLVQQTANSNFTNQIGGTINLDSSATLHINGGTLEPTSGTIQPSGSKQKQPLAANLITEGVTIENGVLTNNFAYIMNNTTLAVTGTLTNADAITVLGNNVVDGSFTNNAGAQVTLEGTDLNGASTLTFNNATTNDGDMILDSTGNQNVTLSSLGTFTNNGLVRTLPGAGGDRDLNMELHNNGTLDIRANTGLGAANSNHNQNGTLTIDNAQLEIVLDASSGITNNGSLQLLANSVLAVVGTGSFDAANGTISGLARKEAGGTPIIALQGVTVQGNLINTLTLIIEDTTFAAGSVLDNQFDLLVLNSNTLNGALQNQAGGILTLTGDSLGNAVLNAPGFDNLGTIRLESSDGIGMTQLNVSGPLNNRASGIIETLSPMPGPQHVLVCELHNEGILQVQEPLELRGTDPAHSNDGQILIEDGQTLTLTDTNPSPPMGTLTSLGGLVLDPNSAVELQGIAYHNARSGIVQGLITGEGQLNATAGTVTTEGALIPGFSPGTLQFSGDLTLQADNNYEVEILGSGGTQHDQIQSSGNIAIDGGLQIDMADFVPIEGETFTILTADSITGTFATIAGAEVGNGLVLVAQYTATSVTMEAMPGGVRWVNIAGGNWSDPTNWSPVQVPDPCSEVMIDLDGSYQIDLDAPVDIWAITLGASSGNQRIVTNGFDIAIQDGSTIGTSGTLQLTNSAVTSSQLACRPARNPGRLGTPALVNNGKIEATGGTSIEVTFGNTGEIVVNGNNSTHGELSMEFGFVNDGTIKLSSTKPAGGDSSLNVGQGTLVSNGTIQAQLGEGGIRQLYAPLDSHGQIEVAADLSLDPEQISLPAKIEAQLAPDEQTLAHYSFDEPTGLMALDRGEQVHLPLTSGALPTQGAIKGARYLNGIDGEIELTSVRDMLEQEETWSVSWYTRSVDDSTPALQMMPHYFAPADTQLKDGYWHQYALSWEGQTLTLYRDGQHSNTHSFEGSEKTREEHAAQIRAQIYLGREPETDSYQAGLVDELRITRDVISPEQNTMTIAMLAIVNDWETASQLNEPEGIRHVWLDAVPVTVLSENNGELHLYTRMLDQANPQTVYYMTHEGRIDQFIDYTLNIDPEEKYTYRLTGTRAENKRATPEFNNFGTLSLSGNTDLTLLNGAMTNTGSGVIQGNGTVDITLASLHNEGLLTAGASPGTLNIEGDISFGSTAVIHIELAGSTPGSGHDVLNISGTASLDGTVDVVFERDYQPIGEERYEVVNFASSSGTFTAVNLPSDPPEVMLVSETGPTGLIIEAEPVYQFQYSQNDYAAAENEGTATITVERVGNTLGSGTVLLTTRETGSASAGLDYEPLSETLNFPSGTTSVEVELTLIDDRHLEGEEMMQLNLSAATGGTVDQADALFIITDVEEGELYIELAAFEASENEGTLEVRVKRQFGSDGDVGVTITSADGTAEAGMDYSALATQLRWVDGDGTPKTVVVELLDDQLVEGPEHFQLNLSAPSGGAILGKPDTATVNLADYEEGQASYQMQEYTVDENEPTAVIEITRVNGSDGPLAATFSTADGSATAGIDYTAVSQDIAFEAGSSGPLFVNIPILDDTLFEQNETVNLTLSDGQARGAPVQTAQLIIAEDDAPNGELQFTAGAMTINEAAGTANIEIVRVNGTGGAVTIDFTTFPVAGGATPGEDYTSVETTLQFEDGTDSQIVQVAILEDDTIEPDETFGVRLTTATGGARIGTPATANITIADNDEPPGSIQLAAGSFSAGESRGTIAIGVTREGGASGEVTVTLTTHETGSATAGEDYTTTQTVLTWADGEDTTKTANIPLIDDTEPEPDETFEVALTEPSGGAVLGQPTEATVTILNDDNNPAGTIRFEQANYDVAEEAGSIELTIQREGGSGGAVELRVSTRNGSAQGGDYGAINQIVTFDDLDQAPKTVTIEILDDLIAEGDEQFRAELNLIAGNAELGDPRRTTVTITDNEHKRVSWSSTNLTRTEGSTSRSVMAMLESPAEEPITIAIEVLGLGNAATQDEDFRLSASQLHFPAGTTAATITVTLLEDDLVEETENAVLRLLEGEASVGDPERFGLVIRDNDESNVNWSDVPSLLQEGGPTKVDQEFIARARLSKAYQDGVTVQYRTAGDATEGQDYRTNTRTLEFGPGQTAASTRIILIDDAQAESDETLELILQNNGPQPGASHTLTIVDDDTRRAVVNWTEANSHVTEDDEGKRSIPIAVEAELSVAFGQAMTVNYEVAGLATPGEDHNLSNGTLHFAAGETIARLEFDVLGDLRQEPDENIAIRLSRGGDIQPGARDTHNVIIRDNDQNQAPDTTISIISPIREGNIFCVRNGEEFRLQASATDPQSDSTFSYTWEICTASGCTQTQGADFTQSIDPAGTYRVTCTAEDNDGNADPTPAILRFQVKENIPPIARIIQPEGRRSDVLQGGSLEFRGEASDPLKRGIDETRWYLQGRENEFETGDTVTWTFPDPGDYTLNYQASDSDGAIATDHHNIHVYQDTAPTRITIEEPANGTEVNLGDFITCVGTSSKQAELTWRWDLGDGTWANGQVVDWTYDQPGRRQIRLFTYNEEGERVGGGTTTVYVRDPGGAPTVTFGFPTGVRLEPDTGKGVGACHFLSAIVLDNKGYDDLSFVYDVPGAQLSNQTPGLVCFPGEGTYTVSLYAVTPQGQQSDVVTRTVTVKAASDEEFEPNDSFAEAASVTPGQYRNLSLDEDDEADTYLVAIAEDNQRLVISAEVVGEAILEVFDTNLEPVGRPRTINGSDNLQLGGLPAGSYYLRISQPDASKRRGLGLSLSIAVLNPALFLADIRSNESFDTSIGVVNPTGEIVCMEIVGFGADGSIIDEVPIELPPLGRQHYRASELFGDLASDVNWVQVDSVGKVLGYTHTTSNDAQELYATSASTQLYSELHAPHIAERVEQWFTRAAVVNGSAEGVAAKVETPTESEPLELDTAFAKDSFEFIERFGGSLPAGPAWANITDENNEATLVGIENFGTHDGSRVSAGLALSDVRRDNPNFTFVQNNIYFTHIARDSTFYTGLALVNLGSLEQGVVIHAYRPDGSEVGSGHTMLLASNEKVVTTAAAILAELGTTTAEVDWLLAEADADITGFELFGTINGKQLAGLEASRALNSLICFPFVDTDPNVAHGVSVLNVNKDAITVTFTLYDNDGGTLGSLPVTLEPTQKYIGILADMFPNIGNNVPGWLEAESSSSDRPLAGFELFLNTANGEQMGAIIAQ